MTYVRIVTALLSLIALLTGSMDVIVGVAGQANIGVGTAASPPFDPVLDSQVRFLGAVWLGLGAIQLICLRDLRRYGAILETSYAVVVLGGVGRALSLAQAEHTPGGTGLSFIGFALFIELALVPSAWLVLRKIGFGSLLMKPPEQR